MEILSGIISLIALGIAIKSDLMMKALANLEYDEKLAIMAGYIGDIGNNNGLIEVATLERIRNDFNAISNLKQYASQDKKEKLINGYVLPIVEKCVKATLASGAAIVLKDIITTAEQYDINTGKLQFNRKYLKSS